MTSTIKDSDFDFQGLKFGLQSSNPTITAGLLQTMLMSFRKTVCEECQSNRVVNILRPKCQNRHFMDLMLFSGYKMNNLPTFCYTVRLKEIYESYQKKIRITADIILFLSDFYRIFGNKKPRYNPQTEFENYLKSFTLTNYLKYEDLYLVGSHRNFFIIDIKNELCYVNPFSMRLYDTKFIMAIIDVYSREYSNFSVECHEEFANFLILTFRFGKLKLQMETTGKLLQKSEYLLGYDEERNELTSEIQFSPKGADFRTEEGGLLFSIIHNLFEHIATTIATSSTKVTSETPITSIISK